MYHKHCVIFKFSSISVFPSRLYTLCWKQCKAKSAGFKRLSLTRWSSLKLHHRSAPSLFATHWRQVFLRLGPYNVKYLVWHYRSRLIIFGWIWWINNILIHCKVGWISKLLIWKLCHYLETFYVEPGPPCSNNNLSKRPHANQEKNIAELIGSEMYLTD